MKITFLLLYVVTTISYTNSITIYNENPNNGLVFEQIDKIYIHAQDEYLFYEFDISAANYIISWMRNTKNICQNLLVEFDLHNIHWNKHNPSPKIPLEYVQKFKKELTANTILNNNIEEFSTNENVTAVCEILNKMIRNFNKMNGDLNKLARLDFSNLNSTVTYNTIIEDIKNTIARFGIDQHIYPIEMPQGKWEQIQKYAKFNFFKRDSYVTITIQIPIYELITYFEMFKKPIIIKNDPYILISNKKYSYYFNNTAYFVKENYLNKDCLYINEEYYCELPQYDSYCEKTMFFQKNDNRCVAPLPKKNIITRIKKKLYVSVLEPVVLMIDCKTASYMIRIDKHSKITNEMGCSINTTQFSYDPRKKLEDNFDLFILDYNTNVDLFNVTTLNLIEFYLTLGYITLILIIYIFTIFASLFKLKKKIKIIKQDMGSVCSMSTESIHVYETVNP